MTPRSGTAVLPALLGAVLLLSGCGGTAVGASGGRPDGRLVMVSGRDDHGLLSRETVVVYGDPAGVEPVGRIEDGTLVRVSRIEGSWLEVSTAEGRAVRGWVDDYFLRGVVRLVGPEPSCAVTLAGDEVEGGTAAVVSAVRGSRVLVAAASDPGRRGWVPRGQLQELPPQGSDCGEDPPGSRHAH